MFFAGKIFLKRQTLPWLSENTQNAYALHNTVLEFNLMCRFEFIIIGTKKETHNLL